MNQGLVSCCFMDGHKVSLRMHSKLKLISYNYLYTIQSFHKLEEDRKMYVTKLQEVCEMVNFPIEINKYIC